MKKRKPDKSVKVSKEFLKDLLTPFFQIEKISDIVDSGKEIIIYYREEV